MQPYSRGSNCASDLVTALVVLPVLSPEFFDGWDDTGVVLFFDNSGNFTINRRAGDSLLIAEIDTSSLLLTRLYILDSASTIIYDGAFSWTTIGDSVPVLREVRLNGYSGFERGGIAFFNIVVNGVSGVRGRQSAPDAQRPHGISLLRSGNSVRFIAPAGMTRTAIYDILGRTVYAVGDMTSGGFSWDGRTGQGAGVAPGWYTLAGFSAGTPVSQRFYYQP